MTRWLLPDGISDVLPQEARRLEELRRAVLDLFRGYGYELVLPPLIEYTESLLTGVGADLDLKTFKLVDQLSGRMLGLRADTTPQVARIDAHILNRRGVTRLCYAGQVLHARPSHPLALREPMQVGAELYGFAGVAADREVQALAVASLRTAGLAQLRFDFGHTGVVRAVLAEVPAMLVEPLTAALAVKDVGAIEDLAADLPAPVRSGLLVMPRLHGGAEVIAQARAVYRGNVAVDKALDDLEAIAAFCRADAVSFDLADLHGYRYYTGVNFAAYVPGAAGAVLRGGRYDDIGRAFGRRRPATGFSIDLRDVASIAPAAAAAQMRRTEGVLVAPSVDDAALAALIDRLRGAGHIVVQRLGDEAIDELSVVGTLERDGVGWRVAATSNP
jgi:ATP phosphoribosyltransferase regulatory subunit